MPRPNVQDRATSEGHWSFQLTGLSGKGAGTRWDPAPLTCIDPAHPGGHLPRVNRNALDTAYGTTAVLAAVHMPVSCSQIRYL